GGGDARTAAPRLSRHTRDVPASSMARLHALAPGPLRARLHQGQDVPVTVDELLASLSATAACCERNDLAAAAHWLTTHRPSPAREVICHGDLHPFNVLVHGDQPTVL